MQTGSIGAEGNNTTPWTTMTVTNIQTCDPTATRQGFQFNMSAKVNTSPIISKSIPLISLLSKMDTNGKKWKLDVKDGLVGEGSTLQVWEAVEGNTNQVFAYNTETNEIYYNPSKSGTPTSDTVNVNVPVETIYPAVAANSATNTPAKPAKVITTYKTITVPAWINQPRSALICLTHNVGVFGWTNARGNYYDPATITLNTCDNNSSQKWVFDFGFEGGKPNIELPQLRSLDNRLQTSTGQSGTAGSQTCVTVSDTTGWLVWTSTFNGGRVSTTGCNGSVPQSIQYTEVGRLLASGGSQLDKFRDLKFIDSTSKESEKENNLNINQKEDSNQETKENQIENQKENDKSFFAALTNNFTTNISNSFNNSLTASLSTNPIFNPIFKTISAAADVLRICIPGPCSSYYAPDSGYSFTVPPAYNPSDPANNTVNCTNVLVIGNASHPCNTNTNPAPTAPPNPAPTNLANPNAIFYIQSLFNQDYVMNVINNSTADQAPMNIYPKLSTSSTGQKWIFNSSNEIRGTSNKCLDSGNGTTNQQLRLQTCTGNWNQKWNIFSDGSIKQYSSNVCISIKPSGYKNGVPYAAYNEYAPIIVDICKSDNCAMYWQAQQLGQVNTKL